MKIVLFGKNDVKVSGGFKKKNNVKEFDEQGFKAYVKENNLALSKGYIDNIGYTSNDLRFRCYYNDMIIGVTKLIEEVRV